MIPWIKNHSKAIAVTIASIVAAAAAFGFDLTSAQAVALTALTAITGVYFAPANVKE
jgi:hypothetical protein